MVRLARMGLVLALLAACGGSSDGDSSSSTDAVESTTTTTTAPSTEIDLHEPIPAGSLYDTPRPPLENTGDDYVGILESLVANFRWLTENPDPAAISELYVPGTADHDGQRSVLTELDANGWRAADDGFYVSNVEVVNTGDGTVTLRLDDSIAFEQIVDAHGDRVGTGRTREPQVQSWVVTLASNGNSWRIADWSPAEAGVVEL